MKGKITKENEVKIQEAAPFIRLNSTTGDLLSKIDDVLNYLKPIKKIKK